MSRDVGNRIDGCQVDERSLYYDNYTKRNVDTEGQWKRR